MSILKAKTNLLLAHSKKISIFACQNAIKKDISDEFPLKYSPSIEKGWYQWWNDSGFFRPKSNSSCQNARKVSKSNRQE